MDSMRHFRSTVSSRSLANKAAQDVLIRELPLTDARAQLIGTNYPSALELLQRCTAEGPQVVGDQGRTYHSTPGASQKQLDLLLQPMSTLRVALMANICFRGPHPALLRRMNHYPSPASVVIFLGDVTWLDPQFLVVEGSWEATLVESFLTLDGDRTQFSRLAECFANRGWPLPATLRSSTVEALL